MGGGGGGGGEDILVGKLFFFPIIKMVFRRRPSRWYPGTESRLSVISPFPREEQIGLNILNCILLYSIRKCFSLIEILKTHINMIFSTFIFLILNISWITKNYFYHNSENNLLHKQ